MKSVVVDVADLKVSCEPRTELVTYSLGSCIGVAVWDPVLRGGGLLHFMPADSSVAPDKAKTHPAMFADRGIPLLCRSAYEFGAVRRRMRVKNAGGAKLFDATERFDVGQQNYVALRKIFRRNGILSDAEQVGDSISRTMRLHVGTGRVTVENRKRRRIELW